LKINLGTTDLPRFQCGDHKLNLAVRFAIKQHELKDILKTLNSSNKDIRKKIMLNHAFVLNKCKLRLENTTRWLSAYLMLESVKRAYDKGIFDENNKCNIELHVVETYLQILKPAYLLSLSFQRAGSSIAETIPSNSFLFNLIFNIRYF